MDADKTKCEVLRQNSSTADEYKNASKSQVIQSKLKTEIQLPLAITPNSNQHFEHNFHKDGL
jgi:hypothetical protein